MPGRPARCVNRTIGKTERYCNVIGDAFGAHVLKEWEALAFRIVKAIPRFVSTGIEDGERIPGELGGFRQIETGGVDDHFRSVAPDEAAAEHVGMQRLH